MEDRGNKTKRLPALPPCKICGEPASGFHYGLNSCGACKGFFLRSLLRPDPYKCSTDGKCQVGPEIKRRKMCQKCRFDKCLRLGMSKNAIKIGRYTYSKRTQDTLELNQLRNNTAQDGSSQENPHELPDFIEAVVLQHTSDVFMTSKPSLCGECPRETFSASNSTTLERENLAKQALSSVDSLPLDLLSLNPNKASDQTNSRSSTIVMSSTSNKRLMSETDESLSIPLQDMSSVNWTSSNSTLAPADPDERVPVQSCQLVSQSSMPISLRHASPVQAHLGQPNHKHYWMQGSKQEIEHPIELATSLLKDQILRKLQRNLLHQSWSSDHQDTRELLPLQRQSPKLIHDPVHYKANAEVFKSDVEMEESRNYSVHEPQISDEKKASGDMEWTPWSSDFTDSELNDWINLLVSYHRMHIFDNTSFDTDQLKARTDSVYNSHRLQETTFGEMKALDRELYFEIYKSTGLDVDGRRTIMSSFLLGIHNEIATVIKFFKQIPGFKHLPTNDQIKLVKGCSHEYHILGLYRGWDNTTRCMTFATLGETLTEQDLRKVFPDEALSAHIQMVMTLQKLNLSSEQIVLLKAIVATAPDLLRALYLMVFGCGGGVKFNYGSDISISSIDRDILEAVEAVTHIHWKLVNCLLYLLCKQDLCPVIKFGQIMSVLTEMRSYSLHIRASYSNIRSDVEELTGKVSLPFIYELFF